MVRGFSREVMVFSIAGGLGLALAGCGVDSRPSPPPDGDAGLSLSPASNIVYECLMDKGWKVILHWDGGIEVNSNTVPEAQLDLYNADSDECWKPIDQRISAMPDDEIVAVYAAELVTSECLVEHGFAVGTPPSKQQYVDTFHRERWSAYGDSDVWSTEPDVDEWRAINEACPQPSWSLGAP